MIQEEWPVLVVVPASLRLMWAEELERWLPHIRPRDVHIIFGGTSSKPPAEAKVWCLPAATCALNHPFCSTSNRFYQPFPWPSHSRCCSLSCWQTGKAVLKRGHSNGCHGFLFVCKSQVMDSKLRLQVWRGFSGMQMSTGHLRVQLPLQAIDSTLISMPCIQSIQSPFMRRFVKPANEAGCLPADHHNLIRHADEILL